MRTSNVISEHGLSIFNCALRMFSQNLEWWESVVSGEKHHTLQPWWAERHLKVRGTFPQKDLVIVRGSIKRGELAVVHAQFNQSWREQGRTDHTVNPLVILKGNYVFNKCPFLRTYLRQYIVFLTHKKSAPWFRVGQWESAAVANGECQWNVEMSCAVQTSLTYLECHAGQKKKKREQITVNPAKTRGLFAQIQQD